MGVSVLLRLFISSNEVHNTLTLSSVYMSRTPFSNIQQWAQWSQRKWNIICTIVMYGETFCCTQLMLPTAWYSLLNTGNKCTEPWQLSSASFENNLGAYFMVCSDSFVFPLRTIRNCSRQNFVFSFVLFRENIVRNRLLNNEQSFQPVVCFNC